MAVSSSHKEERFRANKTSLAPTHFIAVPMLRQDSERLCLCVMGYQFYICLNNDFSNGFDTCSESVVSWFLNLFIYILLTFYLHMYLEWRLYDVSCSETPTKGVKEIWHSNCPTVVNFQDVPFNIMPNIIKQNKAKEFSHDLCLIESGNTVHQCTSHANKKTRGRCCVHRSLFTLLIDSAVILTASLVLPCSFFCSEKCQTQLYF